MPSGAVHNGVTLLTAVNTAALALLYLPLTGVEGLAMVPGSLTALLVNPDLDVDGGNISYKTARRYGVEFIWRTFWFPYSRALPHRHWLSHMPVLSTFIRLVYIFWLPLLLSGRVLEILQHPLVKWYFVGLCIADFHHWFLDLVVKERGRRVYKRQESQTVRRMRH